MTPFVSSLDVTWWEEKGRGRRNVEEVKRKSKRWREGGEGWEWLGGKGMGRVRKKEGRRGNGKGQKKRKWEGLKKKGKERNGKG